MGDAVSVFVAEGVGVDLEIESNSSLSRTITKPVQ